MITTMLKFSQNRSAGNLKNREDLIRYLLKEFANFVLEFIQEYLKQQSKEKKEAEEKKETEEKKEVE